MELFNYPYNGKIFRIADDILHTTQRMSTMDNQINHRMKSVIENQVQEMRRVQKLEAASGIAGESWRKYLAGKQKPTLEMIEFVCTTWPEYAFWISTGISDNAFGHIKAEAVFPQDIKEVSTATRKTFEEKIKNNDFSTVDAIRRRGAFKTLEKLEIIQNDENDESNKPTRIEFLEKIRWLEFFLDNYLLELDVEEAIGSFNKMLKKLWDLKPEAKEKDEIELYEEMTIKFSEYRDKLTKMIKQENAKK